MASSSFEETQQRDLNNLPRIDPTTAHQYPFDVYAGCVTGYLKGCYILSRSHHNLNELQNVHPNWEIRCMCWKNYNEAEILTGQRDNCIISYSMTNGKSYSLPIELPDETGIIRNIKSHDHLLIAAFSKGLVKCQTVNADEITFVRDQDGKTHEDIESGSDLFCMDHNRCHPSLILTGGKENPLKIWDISSPKAPVFTAKNVRNDWLNLTVPIWVTKAEFFSQSNKVVTGTAKAHIRLYDPSSAQRRPVMDIDSKESSPITALAVRPNSEFEVVAGTGKGTLFLVDLRKKSVVRNYKSVKGGVTDIKFHPSIPYFATSSIDRHVYCFKLDAAKQTKCSSIYMLSQINCILFSSLWTSDKTEVEKSKESADKIAENSEQPSISDRSDEEEGEGLWDSMSVVKTKRKVSSAKVTQKKRKRE
ncbi:hypothetical protein RRG08_056808 [Elysia crispata]|uniref:WD repeat-containing protein 74 n=1 Tax=Elysia crispata TaxID=231223 RepID=A0AAE1ABG2_9GAST|nr:hypothetical protein RRG08_056808 [Elysia crispata]